MQASNYFPTTIWFDYKPEFLESLNKASDKYIKDALKLKEQFFETLYDDPYGLNNRSVFYCAQSYRDARHYKESVQWYKLYTRLSGTWEEELFESYMQISKCMMIIGDTDDNIMSWMNKAIEMSPDRAEPYFHLGKYFNDKSFHSGQSIAARSGGTDRCQVQKLANRYQ